VLRRWLLDFSSFFIFIKKTATHPPSDAQAQHKNFFSSAYPLTFWRCGISYCTSDSKSRSLTLDFCQGSVLIPSKHNHDNQILCQYFANHIHIHAGENISLPLKPCLSFGLSGRQRRCNRHPLPQFHRTRPLHNHNHSTHHHLLSVTKSQSKDSLCVYAVCLQTVDTCCTTFDPPHTHTRTDTLTHTQGKHPHLHTHTLAVSHMIAVDSACESTNGDAADFYKKGTKHTVQKIHKLT